MAPSNNPPTPVLESVNVIVRSETECEELKKTYDVESGVHGSNAKLSGKQSHHIFQNAAMKNSTGKRIVTTYSGQAVMLKGGSAKPGSEHDIANKWQAARARKATKEARPTYGQLKKNAKWDLAAAFQHGKPNRGMTKIEAEQLADCLVVEAEKQQEEHRRAKGKRPYKLNDDNRTHPIRGCFATGTLFWISSDVQIAVEKIPDGVWVETKTAPKKVSRKTTCISELVEIEIEDSLICAAPFHRVRLTNGRFVNIDSLRPGFVVDSMNGPKSISRVSYTDDKKEIFSVGFTQRVQCPIGPLGVWIEIPNTGPKISQYIDVNGVSIFESCNKKCQK